MSLIWPSGLPRFRADDFTETLPEGAVRFAADKPGAGKTRAVTTAAPDEIRGVLTMTAAQADTLRTFFRVTTRFGALRFSFPHPRRGVTVEAAFKDPPRIEAVTPRWRASVSLLIYG